MKRKLDIRLATAADAMHIADNMRASDVEELKALHGEDVNLRSRMLESYAASGNSAYTVLTLTGIPVCMFSVIPARGIQKFSVPWLIGTEELDNNWVAFARGSKDMMQLFLEQHPAMQNYVFEGNHLTKKWLRWLGFSIYSPAPRGQKGALFQRFDIGSE